MKFFPQISIEISPQDRVQVFPKATQIISDALVSEFVNIVHASPAVKGSSRSRSDTVLIRKGDASVDDLDQPSYGMSSKCFTLLVCSSIY
jgi:hypothetical protein